MSNNAPMLKPVLSFPAVQEDWYVLAPSNILPVLWRSLCKFFICIEMAWEMAASRSCIILGMMWLQRLFHLFYDRHLLLVGKDKDKKTESNCLCMRQEVISDLCKCYWEPLLVIIILKSPQWAGVLSYTLQRQIWHAWPPSASLKYTVSK